MRRKGFRRFWRRGRRAGGRSQEPGRRSQEPGALHFRVHRSQNKDATLRRFWLPAGTKGLVATSQEPEYERNASAILAPGFWLLASGFWLLVSYSDSMSRLSRRSLLELTPT